MNTDELKNAVDGLGFVGFDSYDCKAQKGRYWLCAFEDNGFLKDGHPNGLVIECDGEKVYNGMIPGTREELITILKLVGAIS